MNSFSQTIVPVLKESPMLPIYCMKSQAEVETIMSALVKTPIRCIEILMRHPFATKAISYIKEKYPDFLVGAGTVVSKKLLKQAIKSGADFFVSPGFDEKLVKLANRKNLAFLSGCSTPSEILKAQNMGLDTVKFFPAEALGGVKTLKLYESAFSGLKFVPTGGINYENILGYSKCSNVIACGGTFMFSKEKIQNGDFEGIYNDIMNKIAFLKGEEK